ncbi:MAG: CoA-binding protein [Bacteroidales bacterium]|nr:CoA-binding protein [Bacteroidales bacterium]
MKTKNKTALAEKIREFLTHKNVAVGGASRDPKKFGNIVLKDLLAKGYAAVPVNPNAEEIDGHKCYPNLSALPKEIDALVLVTPPVQSLLLLKEAIARGFQHVWLQQGSEDNAVIDFCIQNNLKYVSGRCILMHLEPVKGFHGVHRFISKVFGTFPN